MRIIVKVIPRSRHEFIEQLADGSYRVGVRMAPTQGQANDRLIALLASHFRVGRSFVAIIAGHGARRKIIEISE